MRTCSFLLALSVALLSGFTGPLHAQVQTPFFAKDGLKTAQQKAQDSLGSGLELTAVVSGEIDLGISKTSFYLDSTRGNILQPGRLPGQADVWGYVFHSPSQGKFATFFVIKLLVGYQTQSLPAFSFPVTPGARLDFTLPYENSDGMTSRLKSDQTFASYHHTHPAAAPRIVTLGQLAGTDSLTLPISFPVDQPLWTLNFPQQGDSVPGLTCFVGARSGDVFCREVSLPVLSVNDVAGSSGAGIIVAPNPGSGATRITLRLPGSARVADGVGMGLYDMRGARVMDLTASFISNDFQFAEFDSRALPAGLYYCRAAGSGWSATTGVMVERGAR
ncbi:MAG: hypothetical protein JWQ98_688 [Chlorobi bacterium]|jgi:hypothetical protein|nr:hypothetical protein [Chlorobiota bacterium]